MSSTEEEPAKPWTMMKWSAERHNIYGAGTQGAGDIGLVATLIHCKESRARYIVKAANCHDELVDALRGLYDEQNGPPLARRATQWIAARESARAILAKAEKA